MELGAGAELLHYRIVDKIGEGGMGVVWRARDTTLDRDVAIKVLPANFADDPERLARFEREAKLLASLSHPNIAAIYGLHSTTVSADGGGGTVRFIAMEFVPGEDLAERLMRGPLALDEAIGIAGKIARGMAVAHDSGTIHRDLKPANVRLTPSGEVKVLDFGLARAAEPTGGENTANSPTITSAGTVAGALLGTAAYMSPEQARGRAVDRRADVWGFGCVLYEMLTGRRAFPGDTISDILAEVIKGEPDWSLLPASTPAAVRRVLRRCLVKDPEERMRDLGDAALELVEASDDDGHGAAATGAVGGAGDTTAEATGRRPSVGILVAGVLFAVAAGFLLGTLWSGDRDGADDTPTAVPPFAGVVPLPPSARIAYGAAPIGYDSPMLTISADGRHVVYVGRDGDGSRLYRHDLATFAPPEPIPGTEGALTASFSPAEPALAFVTSDKVARVDLNGDRMQVLGDVSAATRLIWADDGGIYVGDSQASVLRRFPEAGGAAETLGEFPYHGLSDVLPGGTGVLYHEKPRTLRCDFGVVRLHDFASGTSRVILENAYDARVVGDRIVFVRGSSLLAAAFDAGRGEVVGESEILVRDVAVDSIFGQSQVALSASGTLVYLPGGDRSLGTIAWTDRDGERGTLPVEPRVYGILNLDPDDRRIAVTVGDVSDYIWIYDLDRETGRKLPTSASVIFPIWNTAGDSITYTETGDTYRVVQQKVDARDAPHVIAESETNLYPSAWSPDDRVLTIGSRPTRFLNIDGEPVADPIDGFMAEFSPDGRWLSYNTDQSGLYETVVRSWPDGDRVYSIQNEGGIEATWSGRGELFYRLGNRWYVVETATDDGGGLTWTPPRLAFEIAFLDTPGRSYDVTSDGRRLYTIVQAVPDIEDRVHVLTGL